MGVLEDLAIFVAGVAAGTLNAIVGSGSLITFPTLLAFGIPPVVANVSNNVGLVPGNASAAWGYRRELAGQRSRLLWLAIFSALGAVAGAAALLALPAGAFNVIVPVLILLSCVLVLLQPRLSARIAARREREQGEAGAEGGSRDRAIRGGPVLAGGLFGAGIYGGYFGAAQGVLVIGLLGTFLDEPMQRINAAKNVLVGFVNGVAAVVYVIFAHVSWIVVLLIAVGSTLGGLIGARAGRRLPATALRIFIVAIGVVASVKLIFF
ncbi:MAG TPA: sulfite exporter TauE/SafE family protein [Streptosporangiaceae bacterium]|nr:sulfite exporter TauE/SafE family protein [Streptosporangiaceae bacterium]